MHLLEISPFLWRISDGFGVQWNGLSFMFSILISFVFVSWMVFRQRAELQQKMVGDFVILSTLGALIGARLGYCVFFAPDLFIKFRSEFPFWGVLAVDEGGMSSLGGIIGVFLVCTLYAIRTGIGRLYLYDLMAITAPIGFFLGRIANFLSGELIGKEAPSNWPLIVKFPTEIYNWPQTSLEKLKELTPVVEQVGVSSSRWHELIASYPSDESSQAAVQETLMKIVDAVQSGTSEVTKLLEPMLLGRHPVQLYGAAAEGASLFLFLFLMWYRPRRPGVVAATFLILFSALHFGLDTYKYVEPQMMTSVFGLTRDQLLSIGGLIVGVVCWFMWNRKEILFTSGWGRGQNVKLHRR